MKFVVVLSLLSVCGCITTPPITSCLAGIDADKYKFDTQYKSKQLDDLGYMSALLDLMVEVDAKEITSKSLKSIGHPYCDVDFNAERWSIQESFDGVAAPKRMR